MNAVAGFLGWLVIWTVVATVAAVVFGKCLRFVGREQPEPEDWEPAPRSLSTPRVPPQWQHDDDLRDLDARDTPPHNPAS